MSNMTLVPAKPVADQARAPKPYTMKLRHLIESQQLTVPLLMELFNRSRRSQFERRGCRLAAAGGRRKDLARQCAPDQGGDKYQHGCSQYDFWSPPGKHTHTVLLRGWSFACAGGQVGCTSEVQPDLPRLDSGLPQRSLDQGLPNPKERGRQIAGVDRRVNAIVASVRRAHIREAC